MYADIHISHDGVKVYVSEILYISSVFELYAAQVLNELFPCNKRYLTRKLDTLFRAHILK